MHEDAVLPTTHFFHGAQIAQASPGHNHPVTMSSPALQVMTDLREVKAATIAPDADLPQAEQAMIYLGVRMLFVVTQMPLLEGLITSTDLHGPYQMSLVHHRGMRWSELRVMDVMTPLAHLDAVPFERMAAARVSNLVATLKASGRQHLLVVEGAGNGAALPRIRGVISRSQIERQLGQAVEVSEIAQSFAEIERALV